MLAINRRTLIGAAALAASLFAVPAFAEDAHPYFKGDAVPLLDLLPPPPAPDSAQTKAELEEVISLMKSATEERKKLAIADDEENVVAFLSGMGVKLSKEQIPLTYALIQRVVDTEDEITTPAKKGFGRKRPPLVNDQIKPLIELSKSGAYPSGHGTNGTATGLVLIKMLPEKKVELFARIKEYSWSRMIVGVHYRSDLDAAYTAGALLAQAVAQNAEFQKDFEPAKAELRKAMGM